MKIYPVSLHLYLLTACLFHGYRLKENPLKYPRTSLKAHFEVIPQSKTDMKMLMSESAHLNPVHFVGLENTGTALVVENR